MKAEEALKIEESKESRVRGSDEAKSLVGGDIETILTQLIYAIQVCCLNEERYDNIHTMTSYLKQCLLIGPYF